MNSASEECIQRLRNQASTIMKKNGVVEGYPTKNCGETFDSIFYNLELEMEKGDWNQDLKYGRHTFQQGPVNEAEGMREVKREFKEILDRTADSAYYECDRDFGFIERGSRPRTYAEKYADAMWAEMVEAPRKAFFLSIPEEERINQRDACKKAVQTLLTDYDLCMRARIPELK